VTGAVRYDTETGLPAFVRLAVEDNVQQLRGRFVRREFAPLVPR
jgi:hypothetical protein